MVYKWFFSCQLGDYISPNHLLREPETAIETMKKTDQHKGGPQEPLTNGVK